MMAILEHAVAAEHFRNHRGDVFFGVRTLNDGFYLAELNALAERAGENLKITLALSDEVASQPAHPHHPNIKLASGFVHEAAEAGLAGRQDDLIGFVAGPPPMVDGALKMLIAQLRLPPEFIRYDKFS
jgi:toluene monooxygenase electron transfer component